MERGSGVHHAVGLAKDTYLVFKATTESNESDSTVLRIEASSSGEKGVQFMDKAAEIIWDRIEESTECML